MVSRSPPKVKKNPILDPNKIKQTVNKVEKCMARLQELQYITSSGRFKHESIRIRNGNGQKSPNGKLQTHIGEWKKMSLPAMILGETVGEILEATRFAKVIVAAVETKPKKKITITTTGGGDPKTPVTESRHNSRLKLENTELNARRKREKQIIRSDIHSPLLLQRAKSRIHFKLSTSPLKNQSEKENSRFVANRVSPKNRPWARKTVIFPNPVFHSTPPNSKRSSSPFNRPTTPHKFLIKTPPARKGKGEASSSSSVVKFQVKIRSPPTISVSPTRHTPKKKTVSPPKKVSTAAKLRRSFSPSRLASRLVSPLKSRKLSVQKRASMDGGGMSMMNMMSGLKQRPMSTITTTPTPMLHLSCRRI